MNNVLWGGWWGLFGVACGLACVWVKAKGRQKFRVKYRDGDSDMEVEASTIEDFEAALKVATKANREAEKRGDT